MSHGASTESQDVSANIVRSFSAQRDVCSMTNATSCGWCLRGSTWIPRMDEDQCQQHHIKYRFTESKLYVKAPPRSQQGKLELVTRERVDVGVGVHVVLTPQAHPI